jgi:asparagine synthase (glutamine-hydrolysing)
MFLHHEKQELLSNRLRKTLTRDTFDSMTSYMGQKNSKIDIFSLCEADRRSYLVDDILVKVDRMSMAHGLETRPIFLDSRLREFAAHLPKRLLINSLWSKVMLRRYIHETAPQINLNVAKRGFSIPVHLWFRSVLKDFWEDTVLSEDLRNRDLFNFSYVEKLWARHQSGKENLGYHLWGLMIIALWLRNNMPMNSSSND